MFLAVQYIGSGLARRNEYFRRSVKSSILRGGLGQPKFTALENALLGRNLGAEGGVALQGYRSTTTAGNPGDVASKLKISAIETW
jgi:hypothetical protein